MVSPGKRTSDDEALVITVIDFGQAVESTIHQQVLG